jgi:hypothetical protein
MSGASGQAALGGFNGIPSLRGLNMPGRADIPLDSIQLYGFAAVQLILIYAALRGLLAT